MDKEEFKIKPHIKSGIAEVDAYIEEMQDYIMTFGTSSIRQMLLSLNKIAFRMVHDLDLIADGDIKYPDTTYIDDKTHKTKTIEGASKLTILDDDSKVFDRVMGLISKIKDFKDLDTLAESLQPEVEELKEQTDSKVVKIGKGNTFEQIQKEKWEKRQAK